MQNTKASDDMPAVTLFLELDPSLSRVASAGDPLHEAVHKALLHRLAETLETLGIPCVPTVQIVVYNEWSLRGSQPMRVSVNGQLCRYSNELLRLVRSYVLGWPLPPEKGKLEILIWLRELCDDTSEATKRNSEMLADFFSLACREIIHKRPNVLLGLSQATVYSASLPDRMDEKYPRPASWPPNPTWLHKILSRVLQLKISIADKQAVAEILWAARERSPEDITEDLIVALRPDVLEIHLPQGYLRQLTTSDPKNELGIFTFLRDGMFEELGLCYPTFRFVAVDYLKPNSFAFKLNHLVTLQHIGLLPDQCLVNDTPERLQLTNIEAKATSNPATGQIASIIDLTLKNLAESFGLTTWTPMGYFILILAAHLRQNSACFVHRQFVQEELDQLRLIFPALVDVVQLKVSVEQITRVFRTLVAEELSIRNLRAILERLMDYTYLVTDSSKGIILENRLTSYEQLSETWLKHPVNMMSFIRAGLKRYIANKYTRGTNTLVVYLLDEKIEDIVLERISPGEDKQGEVVFDEDECDTILDAVGTELVHLPLTAQVPSILTVMDARPYLRGIITTEFPRLSVLCYQELPSDLNIQPVARISVD